MGRIYTVDGKQYYGEHVSRIVSATGTWAAATTLAAIQLDRDFLITNIRMLANMTVTLAATGVADAPKRALQTLQLTGDGKNFLALTGGVQLGRLLAHMNALDTQGASLDSNTDVGDTALVQSYHFHPGVYNPRDTFDLSGCIPARALTNVTATIGTPAAAAMDSGANITTGTYTIELDGVQGVPISKSMFMPGALVTAFPHTAITGAYAQEFGVPTGGYCRRIIILTDDNTAVTPNRADAQITGFQLKASKDSKTLIQHSNYGLKARMAQRYGIVGDAQPAVLGAIATTRPGYNGGMHQPVGLFCIDLRDYFDPILGLNTIGANTSDFILGLTIGVATGTTYIYWDMYYPPQPEWIGK